MKKQNKVDVNITNPVNRIITGSCQLKDLKKYYLFGI